MTDAYTTVEAAIRYLDAHQSRHPCLDELAAALGLSPFHLQRMFSEWAGVSPKRFLQYLTKEHARSLLRADHDALTAALASGLSGSGRLHDLMVNCEALTPGEIRTQGQGIVIRHGCADSVFGRFIVGITIRGICHLSFHAEAMTDADAIAALQADWPHAQLQSATEVALPIARRLAGLGAGEGRLHLLLRGTNFQIKVWEALLRIPPGQLLSYGELAQAIGQPGAARAVGSALAANRIAHLIPCHRVIRETGSFGEYRWSHWRKQAMLAYEQAQREGCRIDTLPQRGLDAEQEV